MISDKGSKYISIIGIFLAVIFVFVSMFSINSTDAIETVSNNIENNVEEVLDKDTITDINIKIDESDWNWLIENATDEEYRSADVTINGETFYNVGVRPKGNSSLSSVANDGTTDRYSLKLDFGEYVDGQTYHGIRKLALNNNISDTTYMKEAISYDVYEFLGIPTPEYSYSDIKINGEDWGLYLAVEVLDERFVEKNYGTNEGNLYKPETMGVGAGNKGDNEKNQMPMEVNNQDLGGMGNPPELPNGEKGDRPMPPNGINNATSEGNGGKAKGPGGMGQNTEGADFKYIDDNIESYSLLRDSAVFKETTDEDFENVVEMMKSLNEGGDIEKYLNVDEVLKYFAVNTFLVNLDSYSGGMYHNYYLYENNGVCEILPWDLNMSFGGFSVNDGSRAVNFPIDSPVTGSLENSPLIGKLLENEEYKEKYHDYLSEIAEGYFNSGNFQNTVLTYDKLTSDYVKKDQTAFYSYDEYKNGVKELLVFGEDRTKSVEAQLKGEQPSAEYGSISTTLNLQALGQQNMGKAPNDMGNKNGVNQENQGAFNANKNDKSVNANNDVGNMNEEKNENINQMGNPNMGNGIPQDDMRNKLQNSNINKVMYIFMGIFGGILLISMIFVVKYKRKKY
ncbi:CotH kinase family protein [Clostridium sp. B9]|uniref:CotH kinase family protein n=1 Tax=Clostridium sp. B9 TaxID=3423224 RepID=UPI003D2F4784